MADQLGRRVTCVGEGPRIELDDPLDHSCDLPETSLVAPFRCVDARRRGLTEVQRHILRNSAQPPNVGLEAGDKGGVATDRSELRLGGEEVDVGGGRSHRDIVHAQGPADQLAPPSVDVHVIVRAGWSV